ncbi:MAG: HEAT repeat domain-containing protein [Bryobacteraceae bacterium]
MGKKDFEKALAELEELRHAPGAAFTVEGLRKALGRKNNYIVAKAAQIAAQLELEILLPELLSAFDRFFINAARSDPQCWAKNAIGRALAELGHDDAAVFIRGLEHRQMEPVWGGQQDTAGALRGNSAHALSQCRGLSYLDILSHLVPPLMDSDKTVRVEAARSIGELGRPEGALLLRLRALAGDEEPEVLGACFLALLGIEGRAGIPFVARFLDSSMDSLGDMCAEAALALASIHQPEVFEILKARFERGRSRPAALLSAIALTRQPEALEYLARMVESRAPGAQAALAALSSVPVPPQMRARLVSIRFPDK